MGAFLRFFVSAPLAAVVTAVIFLALYNQLSPKPLLYTTSEEPGKIFFGNQVLCDCPPQADFFCGWISIPEEPDTDNPWTNSEKAVKEAPQVSATCDFDCPSIDVEMDLPRHPQRMRGDAFGPQYPKTCIKKQAEGIVTVRFDLTPEGRVTKVTILETPDKSFNQAVISTVQKWKYKPLVDNNGKPVARTGVTETFVFEFAD